MKSIFVTKPTTKAIIQTKRVLTDEQKTRDIKFIQTDTQENITRANTELLGVYPSIFPYTAFLFENAKDAIISGDELGTHYQIGTIQNPIPFSHLFENTIIDYTELLKISHKFNEQLKTNNNTIINEKEIKDFFTNEKEQFKIELYRMIKEKRSYWLQDKETGNFILDEPIRIVPVVDNSIVSLNRFNNLVTKQEGGTYKAGEKIPKLGFILYAFKSLFQGHLNNYQPEGHIQGGFIKQHKNFYAIARFYCKYMPNADFRKFTPVKVVQLFYYLSLKNNGIGEYMKVDMLEMLKHVLPSALEGNTIRHKNLKPIASALSVIESITNDFPENFDGIIAGVDFDLWDWKFADKQNPKSKLDRMLLAMKHHLKAHNNKLTLLYYPTKQDDKSNKLRSIAVLAASEAIKTLTVRGRKKKINA